MASDPHDAQIAGMLHLLDQLEGHVRGGRRVALVSLVGVDEQKMLVLIDYLRMAIPTEVQQARRVVRDRAQIIMDAQEQAEQIVVKAQQQAEYIVSRHGVYSEARQRGEEHLRDAHDEGRRTTDAVERYAMSVIDNLEGVMREHLRQIESSRAVLSDGVAHRPQPAGARPQLDR